MFFQLHDKLSTPVSKQDNINKIIIKTHVTENHHEIGYENNKPRKCKTHASSIQPSTLFP